MERRPGVQDCPVVCPVLGRVCADCAAALFAFMNEERKKERCEYLVQITKTKPKLSLRASHGLTNRQSSTHRALQDTVSRIDEEKKNLISTHTYQRRLVTGRVHVLNSASNITSSAMHVSQLTHSHHISLSDEPRSLPHLDALTAVESLQFQILYIQKEVPLWKKWERTVEH